MSDQVTSKAVAEESQVRVAEGALPSSTSSSDTLLSRIAILLFILVAGLLTVFGYYASSICITVILAGFLAILFDPVVVITGKAASATQCRRGRHCARSAPSTLGSKERRLPRSKQFSVSAKVQTPAYVN